MAGDAARRGGLIASFALLSLAYFVSNPYWYGDALWYALDLSGDSGGGMPLDSGHLLWRPLGYGTWRLLEGLGIATDPLDALRLVSSLATALLCIASYRLAVHLTGSRTEAFAAAVLVGVSKLCLAYGGSGSSYTAATAMCTLAFIPIVARRDGEWKLRHAVASCLALAAGWSVWGTSVLVLPGLFVAAVVHAEGSPFRRVLRSGLLCVSAGLLVLLLAALAYDTFSASSPGFLEWVRASSHGRPMSFSFVGGARAVYGLLVSFVHLGSTGTILKNLLLGEKPSLAQAAELLPLIVAAGFGLLLVASFLLLIVRDRSEGSGASRSLPWIALATLFPVAVFAVAWKGSDIERFSLAVPMLAIVAVHGLSEISLRVTRTVAHSSVAVWTLVAIVAVINLGTYVLPVLATRGGVAMAVGRVASENVPPNSLLIVAGHDLFADVVGPAYYFHRIGIHNITYDVVDKGSAGYAERVRAMEEAALSRGAKVVVLSDLLGQPTPGGIGLNEREHPDPSLAELMHLFEGWQTAESWKVDRFTFVVVRPPDDGIERSR